MSYILIDESLILNRIKELEEIAKNNKIDDKANYFSCSGGANELQNLLKQGKKVEEIKKNISYFKQIKDF